MKPCDFEEANKDLQKPASMTDEECGPLPIFSDGIQCISKWEMSWKERFHCLFRGYIWTFVYSGQTQPPIAIEAYKSAFVSDITEFPLLKSEFNRMVKRARGEIK